MRERTVGWWSSPVWIVDHSSRMVTDARTGQRMTMWDAYVAHQKEVIRNRVASVCWLAVAVAVFVLVWGK